MPSSERDDLLGRLMVGLMDAAAMPCLGTAKLDSLTAPSARAPLPRLGDVPRSLDTACLLILEMQVAIGSDRPSRDQQPRLLGDDRVGMDDAKVDSRHPARVHVMMLDGTAAVTASHSRPPSANSVTDLTCSG